MIPRHAPPRVRFTVRRIMVDVAVVALFAGAGVEGERRRARFYRLAVRYEGQAARCSLFAFSGPTHHYKRQVEVFRWRIARLKPYFTAMEKKYRTAEGFPWLPVAPDPPEPE